MHITKYIVSQGYKPFRYINQKLVPDSGNVSFLTMKHGGLDIRYVKEGSPNIIYGLREHGKPPTLISPRPNITVLNDRYEYGFITQERDDAMNICLQKEKVEDIFKAMFDNKIKFEYNLNKE